MIKGHGITKRINHPVYYTSHPSGIECIEIARHYCFSIGNVFKYIWRAGLKTEEGLQPIDKEIEDLEKAKWYIQDRINELKNVRNNNNKQKVEDTKGTSHRFFD